MDVEEHRSFRLSPLILFCELFEKCVDDEMSEMKVKCSFFGRICLNMLIVCMEIDFSTHSHVIFHANSSWHPKQRFFLQNCSWRGHENMSKKGFCHHLMILIRKYVHKTIQNFFWVCHQSIFSLFFHSNSTQEFVSYWSKTFKTCR